MGKRALIIVDMQKDFCAGGTLAVPGADLLVTRINDLVRRARAAGHPVYATRDWHPANHSSFREQGGTWPAHCVAGTAGAGFHDELELPAGVGLVSKATRPDLDAYSGFDGTDLCRRLRSRDVDHLVVCGVATDYCVKATVLDALRAGFDVTVVRDAVASVELEAGDGARALAEMEAAGAAFADAGENDLEQGSERG